MNQAAAQSNSTGTQPSNSTASIVACLGDEAATYAANKHRGGSNGKKGSRYEDFFLAYKIAEITVEKLQGVRADWPFVGSQTLGFVDDVVVSCRNATHYYQLKNAAAITWGAGKHPIATDFSYQYKLACYENQPSPNTHLVVSTQALAEQLRLEVPRDIQTHSSVVYFPYSDALNRLVLENDGLHSTLAGLSKAVTPSKDQLVGVLGVLTMACLNFPHGAPVDQILKSANDYMPHQLSVPGLIDAEVVLSPSFVAILDGIAGLTYDVRKGFFSWSGFGMSGVLSFSCADPQFVTFQETVERVKPTTFDSFEELVP